MRCSSILVISWAVACFACSDDQAPPDAGASACTFDVQYEPSAAIGTVEIVTFTTGGLANPTEAHVDFGPAGAPPTMTAPVDLSEPMHRTVLVGMKGEKPYTFRIVATDGKETCKSADFSFTTGAVPANAPTLEVSKPMPGAAAKGFILTTYGLRVGGVSD